MTASRWDERADFFEDANRFTSIVVAEADELSFLVSTADATVGRSLFLKGNRGEIAVLARVIAVLESLGHGGRVRGSTFLDIGANIGTSTVAAVRLHPFRAGIACEPEPTNYRLLKLNLVLNDVERQVRTLPVAVSENDGPVELALSDRNSGNHQVVGRRGPPRTDGEAHSAERMTVECFSIDRLVQRDLIDPDEVGLVWVDTQGHEGHVLRGAKSLVRRGVPFLLEFHPGLLKRSGGMPLVEHVARYCYTHFVDMRDVLKKDLTNVESDLRSVRELKGLAASLRRERRFTDILLIKLSAEQGDGREG